MEHAAQLKGATQCTHVHNQSKCVDNQLTHEKSVNTLVIEVHNCNQVYCGCAAHMVLFCFMLRVCVYMQVLGHKSWHGPPSAPSKLLPYYSPGPQVGRGMQMRVVRVRTAPWL